MSRFYSIFSPFLSFSLIFSHCLVFEGILGCFSESVSEPMLTSINTWRRCSQEQADAFFSSA